MARKTRLMKEVEEQYGNGRSLTRLLADMYNEMGLPGMAEKLQVSKATLWYWLLRFGITIRRVALAPDEELEVKKKLHPVSGAAVFLRGPWEELQKLPQNLLEMGAWFRVSGAKRGYGPIIYLLETQAA